jgi:hypothetical protein
MFIVGTNKLHEQSLANLYQKLYTHFPSGEDLRSIREQIIHLFQRTPLRLRLERPKVQRVGEIAHDEEQIEAPADALHGDRRHLADHGVEGEGDHDADGDAFAAGFGVEDFGGDDPWFVSQYRWFECSVLRRVFFPRCYSQESGPLVALKLIL